MRQIRQLLLGAALAATATVASAGVGCYGKMWNPLTDINFTLMGGIKAFGMKLSKDPKAVDSPPYASPKTVCACDGGAGVGLGFWMPSYIQDISRRGSGCLGFLNGVEVLGSFSALASGQEAAFHSKGKDGVTSMQVHWAYADITAIAGKQVFERCGKIQNELSIGYLTEVDFTWQNDVYAVIMTPEASLLAAVPILSQIACGVEAVANTLGSWQNIGISGWEGCRFPLSGSTIGKNSAQVVNMDVAIKYLARQSRLGIMLRTTGDDTICEPKMALSYDPFQHRFQWAYPNKAVTRFNQNMLLWGAVVKSNGGSDSLMSLTDEASKISSANATVANVGAAQQTGSTPQAGAATGNQLGLAEDIVSKVPRGLNYPSREAGWMQVWEYRQCCLVLVTIETVVKWVASFAGGDATGIVGDLYQYYKIADYAYSAATIIAQMATDPVGAVLNLAGKAIDYGVSAAVGSIKSGLSSSFGSFTTTTAK